MNLKGTLIMLHVRRKKYIAAFFLLIFSLQLFLPLTAHALTSGPEQPEMSKFEPAGASNLVDLFTGDLKYNIPLLEVEGYPVNLSYNSGAGIEDEASWVGAGWTLNPGAVNRTMRGLPDDFDGSQGEYADKVKKEYTQKRFKKAGGRLVVKGSIFAKEVGSSSPNNLSGGLSISLDIYKDNYWGVGASLGLNPGLSLSNIGGSQFTAGLGVGVNSDTRNGVDISPSLALDGFAIGNSELSLSMGLTGGLTYNTRAGLKEVSLGTSFSTTLTHTGKRVGHSLDNSSVNYFGQSFTPTMDNSRANKGFTFSFDVGGQGKFLGYGVGGAGYRYEEWITDNIISAPAFGYLNYLKGRQNEDALLDFNREKDAVFLESTPALPVPVATHDLFLATGQTGSQQFRPYFGGNYLVNDRKFVNKSSNVTGGGTLNLGDLFKVGSSIYKLTGNDETKKWTDNNAYGAGEENAFSGTLQTAQEPFFYFKQPGELNRTDEEYQGLIQKETEKIKTKSSTTFTSYVKRDNTSRPAISIKKDKRERRNAFFSYLTADKASKYALDKKINGSDRINTFRQPHHISEVTVTDEGGKRMMYGIPVYNKEQQDVSFSIEPSFSNYTGNAEAKRDKAKRSGLVSYTSTEASMGNKSGRLNIFSRETTPPYATAYLLTAVLSPDYVDKTGNGISDDDLGSAVKFNYEQLNADYQWRAPYQQNVANYNEGFNSDQKDDRASYVYGKKEIWYLQSIESKTMIAIFYTKRRVDALGVNGTDGGQNASVKLKYLDKIELYTKADYYKNGSNAIPIKVVHFFYDYSLYPGVPNNSGEGIDKEGLSVDPGDPSNINTAKGKLTLKKVYFTFGDNTRGESNPYEFEYDMRMINDGTINLLPAPPTTDPEHTFSKEAGDYYTERQTDRWGTYKQSWYNYYPYNLSNSEFPYSLQKNHIPAGVAKEDWENLVDRLTSKWQLNKITTPTGGVISVEYESDDYAFVQNRKAMQMCFIKGIGTTAGTATGLPSSDYLVVELPRAISSPEELKKYYLTKQNGKLLENIFFRVYTDLDGKGHYEYVNGYAEIDAENSVPVSGNDHQALLKIKKLKGYNPVARVAWQMLKTDLPQFAYPSYDNTEVGDGEAVIRSIISSIGNLREIVESFDDKAIRKNFADKIDLEKSMVRLFCPGTDDLLAKSGGGSRVKKIQISDEWDNMVSGAKSATYGQLYDYTITEKNIVMSSGVASYEPQIGNEENPFHEPLDFVEKVYWGIDKYHFIEKPFCETYFPAASVGYSRVTVTSIGDDYTGGVPEKHTGYIENEFYTAKDFPTEVEYLTLYPDIYESKLSIQLFSSKYAKRVSASQGFKIELNDMHGKPRSVKVYDKAGEMLSSSKYLYSVENEDADLKKLKNTVDVLDKENSTSQQLVVKQDEEIGVDMEMVTDQRQSKSESRGRRLAPYGGLMSFSIPPVLPFGFLNVGKSETIKNFYSMSMVKVIHRYGIVKKVITTQNGSVIEAENLLWDAETGQVLLTQTQNEYKKYTYSFSYPAYMAYEGMAGAYKNLGAVFTNMQVGTNGNVNAYANDLFPGDELIDIASSGDKKVWVIRSEDDQLHLIDENGDFVNTSSTYQVLRSGRRNMIGAGAGAVICMNDPRGLVGGKLVIDLAVDKKILDSKAAIFKDEWGIPVSSPYYEDCGSSNCTCSCLKNLFDYLINTHQLFIEQSQNITVGQLVSQANTAGYNIGSCQVLEMNTDQLFYALTNEPVATVYTAMIGDCPVSIHSDNNDPVSFYDLTSQACTGENSVTYNSGGYQTISETFYTSCSKNFITYPTGSLSYDDTKILSGYITDNNGVQHDLMYTMFKIDGISTIPVNGFINSANLYMYAVPEGYNPPTYTNAHTISSEMSPLLSTLLLSSHGSAPWDCVSPLSQSIGFGSPAIDFSIQDHFQDFVFDMRLPLTEIIDEGYDPRFLAEISSDNALFPNQFGYFAFASENYSDPAKRPRLEVNYTIPIGDPGTATLEINGCISCPDPVGRKINPYYTGVLGNWRPYISYVYTVSREQKAGNPNQTGGTDIRNSGAYTAYNPFWSFASSGGIVNSIPPGSLNLLPADDRWVWNSKSVYYDQKGNEVESVDPLNRFGSALFGYQQSMATAVAANARHNEIVFDGFEDYDFNIDTTPIPCPLANHFDFGFTKQGSVWTSPAGQIVSDISHTGKYSYKINGTVNVTKQYGSDGNDIMSSSLDYDNIGRYKLVKNELAAGFAPVANKDYILSFWVHDGQPDENNIQGLTVSINGANQNISSVVPVVEEWKRLEIKFNSGTGAAFNLQISGSNIEIDDFRIFPDAGQMNSYVYDDVTMRLMAQLDENNFATLYEYDEEGTPVRVKKETERGVMTLKENRQFFKKRQ